MSVGELIERAFAYRGFVTISRRDGSLVVGYLYDRGPSHVEMYDESATQRIRIERSEIADIAFTGEDPAEITRFLSTGMLLNVLAALGIPHDADRHHLPASLDAWARGADAPDRARQKGVSP